MPKKPNCSSIISNTSLSQVAEDTRPGDNTEHYNDYYKRDVNIVKRCAGYDEITVVKIK